MTETKADTSTDEDAVLTEREHGTDTHSPSPAAPPFSHLLICG